MQRASSLIRATPRAFAPALSNRAYSLSKLQLIGRLTHDPEVRMSKNDKEYVSYTVATTNYPPPPPNPDGSRPNAPSSFHKILSFNNFSNTYLKTVRKGALVYVEATFEIREDRSVNDSGESSVQRQVFCRHENLRVLKHAPRPEDALE